MIVVDRALAQHLEVRQGASAPCSGRVGMAAGSCGQQMVCPGASMWAGEVGHVAEQETLECHLLGNVHGDSVDREVDATEGQQIEAGGSDADVGRQFASGLQPDSVFGKSIDRLGDHRGPAVADGLEHVGIWHRAQALVPWVVDRLEVLVGRISGGQLLGVEMTDQSPGGSRIPLA